MLRTQSNNSSSDEIPPLHRETSILQLLWLVQRDLRVFTHSRKKKKKKRGGEGEKTKKDDKLKDSSAACKKLMQSPTI